MNKEFLYFLRDLTDLQKKHQYYLPATTFDKMNLTASIITRGIYVQSYNLKHREPVEQIRKELLAIGLEVPELVEKEHELVLEIKLPLNPTKELLYGKA